MDYMMPGMDGVVTLRAWKHRIDTDVVIITHVGCTVRQQEMIRKEVLRYVPFDKVIMQRVSFSSACNSGLGTIGIAYDTKV